MTKDMCSEEIDERFANEADLKEYLDQATSSWKKYKDLSLDLSVEQFWSEFFDESAKFGFDRHMEIQKFWDIKIEPFEEKKRVLTLVVPVSGVPFLSQTRVTKTITLVHRSDNKIILEIQSKTHEAPYSDTFVCREAWVIVGSAKESKYPHVNLTQFYKVQFNKYTMF